MMVRVHVELIRMQVVLQHDPAESALAHARRARDQHAAVITTRRAGFHFRTKQSQQLVVNVGVAFVLDSLGKWREETSSHKVAEPVRVQETITDRALYFRLDFLIGIFLVAINGHIHSCVLQRFLFW